MSIYIAHRCKKKYLMRSMCRVLIQKTSSVYDDSTKTVKLHVRLTQIVWNKIKKYVLSNGNRSKRLTCQNVLPVKSQNVPVSQNVPRPWSKRPMCAWPFKTLLVKMSFRAILLLNRNTAAMWERWRWRWRRNLWSYQCRIAERETKAGRQFWFFIHSQKGILDW